MFFFYTSHEQFIKKIKKTAVYNCIQKNKIYKNKLKQEGGVLVYRKLQNIAEQNKT